MMRKVLILILFGLVTLPAAVADLEEELRAGCASAICILADSGLPIREFNAEEIRPPASMVKLMQMLMVAEGMKEKKWTLETVITITSHTESMGGSQVYLKEGEEWTLDELLSALCVASANDAAMAIAEGLWGSEEDYLKAMNARAQELGMTSSRFHSVHGLPPDAGEEPDRTCARDMSILARHCVLEPLIMGWVGQKELTFREGDAIKYNTNKLLWQLEGCDGLKTGYTRAAGWCLTATAERDGVRLIAVVMGGKTSSGRFKLTEAVLEEGFQETERLRILAKDERVDPEVPVQNSEVAGTRLAAAREVWVTIPKKRKTELKMFTETPAVLHPPLEAGMPVGELRIALGDAVLAETPLTLAESLTPASLRWKLVRTVLQP